MIFLCEMCALRLSRRSRALEGLETRFQVRLTGIPIVVMMQYAQSRSRLMSCCTMYDGLRAREEQSTIVQS